MIDDMRQNGKFIGAAQSGYQTQNSRGGYLSQ
jgi:hypothetical protein